VSVRPGRGPYHHRRVTSARDATRQTAEINALAESNSDLDSWFALRDLLGAHPHQSIEDAAARVLRDAMPGAARSAARVIVMTKDSADPWGDIRSALKAAGRLS
jgi:hypothetical protein